MADEKITDLTADTSPTTDDLVVIVNDPAGTPANKKATLGNVLKLAKVQQVVNTQTGAVATGTTTIPGDDTIPQNTEGTEFITQAITPTNAGNKLRIDVVLVYSASIIVTVVAALFQDSTAGALAAVLSTQPGVGYICTMAFTHYMAAGTTSATTFKVRVGGASASTITLNGAGAARLLGGAIASSITITEIVP